MTRRDPYTGLCCPIIAVINYYWMHEGGPRGRSRSEVRDELARQGVDIEKPYRHWRHFPADDWYFENTEDITL